MNPLLKLSVKIEKLLTGINQALPAWAWYTILFLTILGSVFFSNYFGPEINSAFVFIWCFSIIIQIFADSDPSSKTSYLGLFFGAFLFLVFMVLLIRSILYYL